MICHLPSAFSSVTGVFCLMVSWVTSAAFTLRITVAVLAGSNLFRRLAVLRPIKNAAERAENNHCNDQTAEIHKPLIVSSTRRECP